MAPERVSEWRGSENCANTAAAAGSFGEGAGADVFLGLPVVCVGPIGDQPLAAAAALKKVTLPLA
jgi:hypothetical protein